MRSMVTDQRRLGQPNTPEHHQPQHETGRSRADRADQVPGRRLGRRRNLREPGGPTPAEVVAMVVEQMGPHAPRHDPNDTEHEQTPMQRHLAGVAEAVALLEIVDGGGHGPVARVRPGGALPSVAQGGRSARDGLSDHPRSGRDAIYVILAIAWLLLVPLGETMSAGSGTASPAGVRVRADLSSPQHVVLACKHPRSAQW